MIFSDKISFFYVGKYMLEFEEILRQSRMVNLKTDKGGSKTISHQSLTPFRGDIRYAAESVV